jgi:hypothetical protein
MRFPFSLISALFVASLVWTSVARGIAPPYVSDEELASYPIIVVAKWERAPATEHHKYRSPGVVIKSEIYTRLNILSIVKGEAQPGVNNLMVGWGITWRTDGTYVNTGTSTQLPGDVDDVTKPCLWFLKRTHSWDPKRKEEYLTVSNYREIQPLELKEFYAALGSDDAAVQVPKLMTADQPLVAERVLRHVCGGGLWWPYDDTPFFARRERKGKLLRSAADSVWAIVQSDAKELRPAAASVYAELSGERGLANLRTLLDDDDPDVRGIAVGVLAHHRDEASVDHFSKAVEGIANAKIAYHVVLELAAWKDERVVLPLIAFLQNDGSAYRLGDDLGMPALKAREALLAITGHLFPFDVERSRGAWQAAVRLDDKEARKRLLEKKAPGRQAPLTATTRGTPRKELTEELKQRYGELGEREVVVTIRLHNVSPRPVTILKRPTEVGLSWPGGNAGFGSFPFADADELEFLTLQSNETVDLDLKLYSDFLSANPSQHKLKLYYRRASQQEGANAWVGIVSVEFETERKSKRTGKR